MKKLQPISNRTDATRGSSLAQVKTASLARDEEEKARLRRVRGLLVLVEQFLLDQGYVQTLQLIQQESGVSLQAFTPADNVDLLTVVVEFEQYYELRFQRKPKLFRPRGGSDEDGSNFGTLGGRAGGEKTLGRRPKPSSGGTLPTSAEPTYASIGASTAASASASPPKHLRPAGHLARALTAANTLNTKTGSSATGNPLPGSLGKDRINGGENDSNGEEFADLTLAGQKMGVHTTRGGGSADGDSDSDMDAKDGGTFCSGRALRPLPIFPSTELNDLALAIMRDILDVNPAVRWNDIAELESAKHLLKEAVVMPVKYPELFEGIMRPWKGILLFGPPGTGKTLLAKAVATECKTTFFNISASSVVSKWRGDSEKLVRMLFDLAVHYSPSTIFIDEVDSLMSARSSEGEHEGSRRMKTELLSQMDGLSKRRGGDVVFVLAASNTPWDLDTAMLRRLEKRVLITLPSSHGRELMFRRLLHRNVPAADANNSAATSAADSSADAKTNISVANSMDWAACAALTEGMSGADIDIVCREAMMRPIRKLIEKLEAPHAGKRHENFLEGVKLTRPTVSLEDVEASVACTRSSVSWDDLHRYDTWAAKFGSGLSS